MEHEDRNETIRLKMLDEIADIEAFISNRSLEALFEERMCQKAVVMSLVNLGELSKSFTQSYLDSMPEIPWKAIRGFRNIAVHQYGAIDFRFVLVFKLYLAMVCQSSDRSLIGVHDDHMCIIPHQKRFDL